MTNLCQFFTSQLNADTVPCYSLTELFNSESNQRYTFAVRHATYPSMQFLLCSKRSSPCSSIAIRFDTLLFLLTSKQIFTSPFCCSPYLINATPRLSYSFRIASFLIHHSAYVCYSVSVPIYAVPALCFPLPVQCFAQLINAIASRLNAISDCFYSAISSHVNLPLPLFLHCPAP